MKLPPLVAGTLIQRYKRFLADVTLDTGETVTAHVANSGSMLGLALPGARVHLAYSADPKRKLPWSWELVEVAGGFIGVNTGRPNAIGAEAIASGAIPELAGYPSLRREVAYGHNSRIDLLLEAPDRPAAYVEIKSVTLARLAGLAEFPDAVTARGTKHLDDLAREVSKGNRGVMLYLVQIPAVTGFALAADIDPAYAAGFAAARSMGVEALAYRCVVTTDAISIGTRIETFPA